MADAARDIDTGRSHAKVRPVRLGPAAVAAERRGETVILRAPQPLAPYPDKLTERLDHWAAHAPDRVFLAQRDGDSGWRSLTYAQTRERVQRLAAALLPLGLSAERPIVVLSGNDIEHALLELAALTIGVPYAPVSPAYSLISTDFGKLRQIVGLLTPGLVFAADGGLFQRAIRAAVPDDVPVFTARNPLAGRKTIPFSELDAAPGEAVAAAHACVDPDTIAKFLFTSGSTGAPKAVINTQRMLCANQEMIRAALAYFRDEPPVLVDWAPWHHTAGGNHDFGIALYNGGSLYIDEGKPLPGAIETTVRNLREVAPTWYFNVPKGYEALLPHLRRDGDLRRRFFSRLKVLWFAGAGISQPVFDAMKALSIETCGESIVFLTGFGATETAPCALARTFETDNAANMGVPVPGMELKLIPLDGRFEARVKGPNVTPGYWRNDAMTAAAFDAEGYYRLGDAFRFADPGDPARGLLFEGRIAEDFKLSTGTWTIVGPLRAAFLNHLAPLARDVVIAAPDRPELTALIFPDLDACRGLCGDLAAGTDAATILAHPAVRAAFAARLAAFAARSTGTSNRIVRALLLEAPPSLDAGEMTDKGSINQRAVLANRAALVHELYAEPRSPRIITAEGSERWPAR